ncbi:hypothetical protein HK097_004876 [Rhizophlyctis rosea]|uniref:Pentatricopeptide repeat-containing protein n=1 Tax=Rhizophlyctis rosea TaxID=64517 RepID=A0AAD5SM93_9FUNG|nr:hypothetical protein HK097_004876 [Rhizophlyctis rosea]
MKFLLRGLRKNPDQRTKLQRLELINDAFRRSQRPLTPQIYSEILVVLDRDMLFDDAIRILDQMKSWSVEPNVVVYNSILRNLVQRKDKKGFTKILRRMEDDSLTPDAHMYFQIVRHEINAQGARAGEKMLTSLLECDAEVDKLTWSAVIDAYSKEANYDKVHEMYNKFTKTGLGAHGAIFSSLVFTQLRCKDDIPGAVQYLEKAVMEGCPNGRSYDALIYQLCNFRGDLDSVEAAEGHLRDAMEWNLPLQERAFERVRTAYKNLGMLTEAERISDREQRYRFLSVVKADAKKRNTLQDAADELEHERLRLLLGVRR